jgi:hypothetical protein
MTAESATNGGGVALKALYPGDASCFSGYSFAGVINNCTTARWISTTLPVPTGWHGTNVTVYGNGTMCHTISTNGVGNGANLGADIWTLAGPKNWQTLNTGDRYVWDWSPVLFECLLESGGIVGGFTAL